VISSAGQILKYSRLSPRQMRAWELCIFFSIGEQCQGIIPILRARMNPILPSLRIKTCQVLRISVMISALLRVCRVWYFWKDKYQCQMAPRAICLHYSDVSRITAAVCARSNEMHFFHTSLANTFLLSSGLISCYRCENESPECLMHFERHGT